jgi:hypothetical protein
MQTSNRRILFQTHNDSISLSFARALCGTGILPKPHSPSVSGVAVRTSTSTTQATHVQFLHTILYQFQMGHLQGPHTERRPQPSLCQRPQTRPPPGAPPTRLPPCCRSSTRRAVTRTTVLERERKRISEHGRRGHLVCYDLQKENGVTSRHTKSSSGSVVNMFSPGQNRAMLIRVSFSSSFESTESTR